MTAAIELRSVSKSFVEGKPVLRNVDLAVERGEVRALVGANGSGKSTLVKVLAGFHAPDRGSQVTIDGERASLPVDPAVLRRAGVRFVHQDYGIVSGMSVTDNLRLGHRYDCSLGWKIRWRREAKSVGGMLARLDLHVDPLSDVEHFPLATVAKLAVLRALGELPGERVRAVVLDEATSSLGREDSSQVLRWVRQLARDEKVGVLLVSHRLSEVMENADTVTVLRNGEVVTSARVSDVSVESLVEAIVGRRIESLYPGRPTATHDPMLKVAGLRGGSVTHVSFSLARGEILGLTGLPGSGFDEVPYLLMDPQRRASGTCRIDGRPISLSGPIAARVRQGLVLVPTDRARTGIAPNLGVRENVVLPRLSQFFKRGLLRRRDERRDALGVMDGLEVVPPEPDMPLGQLSGGNQQKVLVGKWLATSPKVLLLDEPTEGVDVGARVEIFRALAAFAEAGNSVIISSVEYEDLAHLCHRILVFGHGTSTYELQGPDLSTEGVVAAAYSADTGVVDNTGGKHVDRG